MFADVADRIDQATAARFAKLASAWRADTGPLSLPAEIADHPAYREIIAMGEPAIWLILADLETRQDQWFGALRALTSEDPVPAEAEGDLAAMATAWLDWGRHEEADRAEAERIAPRRAQLDAMIDRGSTSTIDYSLDDDELPC